MTSALVTGFISSAATAVITVVVCLVKQKRQRPKESVATTTPSDHTYTTTPSDHTYDDPAEVTVTNGVVAVYSTLRYADNNN